MRAYLVLAALAAFSVSPALAETLHFKATLTGPAETPPTDSKGTGTVDATYDDATKTLGWTINYSGLTGPAIAAHFHGPAAAGTAAPIEVPLTGSLDSPIKGSATGWRRDRPLSIRPCDILWPGLRARPARSGLRVTRAAPKAFWRDPAVQPAGAARRNGRL